MMVSAVARDVGIYLNFEEEEKKRAEPMNFTSNRIIMRDMSVDARERTKLMQIGHIVSQNTTRYKGDWWSDIMVRMLNKNNKTC